MVAEYEELEAKLLVTKPNTTPWNWTDEEPSTPEAGT